MQEDTYKKIRESFRFKESGEEIYVEIGMKNVPSGIETGALIDFFKTLFDEAIGQLNDPVIPDTEQKEHDHGFSAEGAKEFDALSQEGSDPDNRILSTLQGIRGILERIAGTSSDTVLGPGTVVVAPTCAPGITKEDIQTYCRLSQEEFDKMMQYYEKRKSRKIHVDGRGDVPEMVISIPCPPKGGRDDSSQSHMQDIDIVVIYRAAHQDTQGEEAS